MAIGQNKLFNPKQIIFIADIHGAVDKLEDLMSKIELQKDTHLVFLGDYIGNGNNLKTLKVLQDIKNKHSNTFFLKGNHEDSLLSYLKTNKQSFLEYQAFQKNFLELGYPMFNKDLLKQYLKEKNITFLNNLLNYYETNNILATHAPLSTDSLKYNELDDDEVLFDCSWNFINKEHEKVNKVDKWLICGHQSQKLRRDRVYPSIYKDTKKIFLDCGVGYRKAKLYGIVFPELKIISSSELLYIQDNDKKCSHKP